MRSNWTRRPPPGSGRRRGQSDADQRGLSYQGGHARGGHRGRFVGGLASDGVRGRGVRRCAGDGHQPDVGDVPVPRDQRRHASFSCKLDSGKLQRLHIPGQPLESGRGCARVLGGGGNRCRSADAEHLQLEGRPDASHDEVTGHPPALTNSTTATFTFTSPDATATFRCSLNAAPAQACTSPVVYSGLADATRSLLIQAVDPAGNVDPTAQPIVWTVDSTPPDTAIANPGNVVGNDVVVFSFTSTEAGSTFQCAFGNAPFSHVHLPGRGRRARLGRTRVQGPGDRRGREHRSDASRLSMDERSDAAKAAEGHDLRGPGRKRRPGRAGAGGPAESGAGRDVHESRGEHSEHADVHARHPAARPMVERRDGQVLRRHDRRVPAGLDRDGLPRRGRRACQSSTRTPSEPR